MQHPPKQYFAVLYMGVWAMDSGQRNSKELAAQECFKVHAWLCRRVVPIGSDPSLAQIRFDNLSSKELADDPPHNQD